MSLRKLLITGALALSVSVLAPSPAAADWLFTPFIGGTFGGSADFQGLNEDFESEFERKLTYGASIGYMGAGVIGFEVDFGYSPNFFGGGDNDDDINFVGDSNVTTLMANLLIGAPIGPVRPYVSGGAGLIRISADNASNFFDDAESNLGVNVGAGVLGFFNDNVGIRGDVRYFRRVNSNDDDNVDLSFGDFRFWRGTVGITFRF